MDESGRAVGRVEQTMKQTVAGRKVLPALIAMIGIGVAAIAIGWWQSQPPPIPEHLRTTGGDFTLQSADGPVALQEFRGNVVLIYFGYTHCPDACPMTLTNWSRAFKGLTEKERSRVNGMLVSVDPERDTPEILKEYVTYFHPNIIGVTGTIDTLREIARLYYSDFVIEKEGQADEYEVAHMSFVYVVDPQGKVRGLLTHDSPPQEVIREIRNGLRVVP